MHPGQDPYGQQHPQYPTAPAYPDPYAAPPTSGQPAYGPPAHPDPYAQPAYGPAPVAPRDNTHGLVALILGIVAIPLAWPCAPLGMILGVAAVVVGLIGRSRARQGLAGNGGLALAGAICGAAALVVGLAIMGYGVFMAVDGWSDLNRAGLPD